MNSLIKDTTPIEEYNGVYVKREDLCAPDGAPPFSKIRGLLPHLDKLKKEGCKGVAYVETSVSMAGWGISWACKQLDMKCLIFNPVYKKTPPILEYHRKQWELNGAYIVNIPAGRAKVNYYIAKKQIPEGYVLLPLGIPLKESIKETEKIASECISDFNTIVICVGSGTIASGVFTATNYNQHMYGIMSRSGNKELKRKHIMESVAFFPSEKAHLEIIDEGWEYAKACFTHVPFPCHPYYDAKAWDWLIRNKKELKPPILFWNIGSTGSFLEEEE